MEINKIYNLDCLKGMQEMQPESVDLILCDPPYGTIKNLGKYSAEQYMQTQNTQWDEIIPTADLFAGFFRVLRNNGALVLFSQEPYTSHIRTHRVKNLNFCYPMIYEKTTTGNPLKAKIAPLSFFEDVSVWRKRVDVTDEAHPLRDYARRLVEWIGKDYKQVAKDFEAKGIEKPTRAQHFLSWNCRQWHLCTAETYDLLIEFYNIDVWGGYVPFGELYAQDRKFQQENTPAGATYNIPNGLEYVSNILRCNKDLNTFHPTQKPLDLMAFLVDVFSNPGDLVLDACMGSGTTAVACIKEKRNFIGFETDPTFYAKACQRIEEARKNITLF